MSEQTNTAENKAPPANEHLIWVDMEMSGLNPETERILEVAIIVTDAHLNTIATAPVWVVHQDDALLDAMDAWNKGTHGRSGLIDKVKTSPLDEATVEAHCLFTEIHQGWYCANVWQYDWPGSSLYGQVHAKVRSLFSLSKY